MMYLSVLCILAVHTSLSTTQEFNENECKVKLKAENYQQLWSVDAGGDPNAVEALYGNSVFEFNPTTITKYEINFLNKVYLARVKVNVRGADSLRIDVYNDAENVYNENRNIEDPGEWSLNKRAFVVKKHPVSKVTFTWTSSSSKVELKKITTVVCPLEETCTDSLEFVTGKDLVLPSGIDVQTAETLSGDCPGDRCSDKPAAIMYDTKTGGILLDDDNKVILTFEPAIILREMLVHLRDSEGAEVTCYSDDDGNDILYTRKSSYQNKWLSYEEKPFLGAIRGVKRCDLSIDQDPDFDYVLTKNLKLYTCTESS